MNDLDLCLEVFVKVMSTIASHSPLNISETVSLIPKPLVIRKDLGDISYIGRVIADFVPNFVAMATGG